MWNDGISARLSQRLGGVSEVFVFKYIFFDIFFISLSGSGVGWGVGSWRTAIRVPSSVWLNNESYYAHISLVRHGRSAYASQHQAVKAPGTIKTK